MNIENSKITINKLTKNNEIVHERIYKDSIETLDKLIVKCEHFLKSVGLV